MINEVSGLCLEDDRQFDRLYISWPFRHSFCTDINNCPAPWLCQPFQPPTSQRVVATAHSYNLVRKRCCSLGYIQGRPSTGVPAWRPAFTTTEYFRRHTTEKTTCQEWTKGSVAHVAPPLTRWRWGIQMQERQDDDGGCEGSISLVK